MIKIILIGYMGSGKSTIAHLLAEKLGIAALDLDSVIEENTGLAIPSVFKEKGEVWFRKLEHKLLKQIIDSPEPMVLSLGGGTPCYANNHELLNAGNTVSIYLRASVKTLMERLAVSGKNRPLIAGLKGEDLQEFIAKHLFDRSFYYNQATYKVDADGKTAAEITEEIITFLA